MPVIVVKARKGVLMTGEQKRVLIEGVAEAFARAAGDDGYKERTTVIIEETPDENWGSMGKPFGS
ncbi:MAG: tautomerase family protein [Syntrophobacteraceae bacterium]|nr:tautomerase family protein [Syntrophobacteraceae bacterium]